MVFQAMFPLGQFYLCDNVAFVAMLNLWQFYTWYLRQCKVMATVYEFCRIAFIARLDAFKVTCTIPV